MNKRLIKSQVYKTLLSRSGNKCAFLGCTQAIFNDKFEFIAQLCHIEAVSMNGERFNNKLTVEEINSYGNLMFMCYKHHVETNDVKVYTVDVLKEIKREHESKYIFSPFNIDMSHIFSLRLDIENYWKKVEDANTKEHIIPDLKIDIDTKAGYDELNNQISATLNSLEKLLSIIEKDDKNKYWEIFNIGLPNHINAVRVLLDHMIIKYYEEKLINSPHDTSLRDKFDNLRKHFLENAKRYAHID